jgi:glutamate N-acetyltransferase/amino-acid acetyltransferase
LSSFDTQAHTVHLQPDSKIVLPGGNVFVSATDNPFNAEEGNSGRVLVDKGAKIDVSGLKQIPASIERNVIEVPVQSFELRDSPLQKDGVLKGQTVRVDRRVDTEIVDTSGAEARFAGIAKGSGMIAPNMATMLSYVFTDAAVAPALLQSALREAADLTFNAVTVDGDTSTSDTLMVFATGASGMPLIEDRADPRFRDFFRALHSVCHDLAMQVVKDGEGASKIAAIRVEGAVSESSAKAVAVSIANSPLIKTAMAAGDANWGRIVMAVGKSYEQVDIDKLAIWFDAVQVAKDGARAPDYDEVAASAVFAKSEFAIRVHLGVGDARAQVWTCDLTHGYVDINGAYRT